MLHDKHIVVGFFYLHFVDSTIDFRSVSREPLVVALPETHPLVEEVEIDLRTLEREPFILPMRYQIPGLYGHVMQVCCQAGFVPRAVQKDVWLMQTIVGLVAGGTGVALVPASLRNFRRKGVVYKSVHGLSPTVELGLIWRRDDQGAVLNSFLEVARRALRDDGETGDRRATEVSHRPV